jgi:DNA processing protein
LLDDRTIWYNISLTDGLGPAAAQKIAIRLDELRCGPEIILEKDADWLQSEFGLSARVSESLLLQIGQSISLPEIEYPISILLPGDAEFPNDRFNRANPALPVVLWALGDRRLLNHRSLSIGIAGSRDAHELAIEATRELAKSASSNGNLIVSGLAQGVDTAAHEGALLGRSGTIGVMASGVKRHQGFMPADETDSVCLISQFMPNEPWSGPRAMQRNSVIASLSDRVVVAASGTSGGSWEMAQLCLKRKKPLYVMNFDEDISPGNQALINAGGIALELDAIDKCWTDEVAGDEPLSLF